MAKKWEWRQFVLESFVTVAYFFTKVFFLFLRGHRHAMAQSLLREKLSPTWTVQVPDGKTIRYDASDFKSLRRALTLFSKEPDTIIWLNEMQADETLWDIGANVGMYSIYAASQRNMRVYAFEPVFFNYNVLNRNVELNELVEKVTAYCIAVAAESGANVMNLEWTRVASSRHQLGVTRQVDGREFVPVFKQGIFGFSGDDLVTHWGIGMPDHIKIDVDGLEFQLLNGMSRMLREDHVKTVLVEVGSPRDDNQHRARIISFMEKHGFQLRSSGRANAIFARSSARIGC